MKFSTLFCNYFRINLKGTAEYTKDILRNCKHSLFQIVGTFRRVIAHFQFNKATWRKKQPSECCVTIFIDTSGMPFAQMLLLTFLNINKASVFHITKATASIFRMTFESMPTIRSRRGVMPQSRPTSWLICDKCSEREPLPIKENII